MIFALGRNLGLVGSLDSGETKPPTRPSLHFDLMGREGGRVFVTCSAWQGV